MQFFVVGHDCGHRSFSKNKLVEDVVGTLMFAPLIYPFDPWRIKHNQHHAHTNKCASRSAFRQDQAFARPPVLGALTHR
jgi:omega-6 fatty acid desaturase (delta-12 desaturase)